MRHKVLANLIILTTILIISCDALGISSKLDFGDAQSSPKLIGTQYRTNPLNYRSVKREDEKPNGDFGNIGVVCVDGGCNTTKSTAGSKDSVETDVVVHVKTNIDLNKSNKTSLVDDTPDVPVVVGLAGTNGRDNVDNTYTKINQRPLVVTNIDETFFPLRPEIHSSPTPSFVPSFTPSLNPYPSPYTPQSDSVYVQKPSFIGEPRVDINIKTLPPLTITMSDDGRHIKDIRYKTNGIETHVPYFEPSFNNHYFGEHPPPQLLWYPKRPSTLNPVEFKNIPKAAWKPSFWGNVEHKHTMNSENTCSCKNQPTTGLQWHPNRRAFSEDPGSQINDKLAPLN